MEPGPVLLQPARQREPVTPGQLPQDIQHLCGCDAALIRERQAQTLFERPLQHAAELQETGIPFPVVAYAREPLIMQLVTAVERQLEVLIDEYLVGADARSSEGPDRMRKCLEHRMADRTSR